MVRLKNKIDKKYKKKNSFKSDLLTEKCELFFLFGNNNNIYLFYLCSLCNWYIEEKSSPLYKTKTDKKESHNQSIWVQLRMNQIIDV